MIKAAMEEEPPYESFSEYTVAHLEDCITHPANSPYIRNLAKKELDFRKKVIA